MTTSVTRRWGVPKPKRATGTLVFLQFAKERKIAPATAKNWFYGNIGSPLNDVVNMAALAARYGRMDLVEGFIQRMRAASSSIRPYAEAWMAYHNADTLEEMTQGEFDEKERTGEVTDGDVRKRSKSITLEIAAAGQYQDSLLDKYGL